MMLTKPSTEQVRNTADPIRTRANTAFFIALSSQMRAGWPDPHTVNLFWLEVNSFDFIEPRQETTILLRISRDQGVCRLSPSLFFGFLLSEILPTGSSFPPLPHVFWRRIGGHQRSRAAQRRTWAIRKRPSRRRCTSSVTPRSGGTAFDICVLTSRMY